MHYIEVFVSGLSVGAALAYAFRGWIERTKAKEAAALQQAAESAATRAQSAVGGFIKKL